VADRRHGPLLALGALIAGLIVSLAVAGGAQAQAILAAPVASNDAPGGSVTVQYGDPAPSVTVSASDDDTPGDQLTAVATGLPSGITLEHVSDSGALTLPGTASWALTGASITAAPNTYNVSVTVTDELAASDVTSFDIIVEKADQTVAFAVLGDKTYGDPDFDVSATASSGLAVAFEPAGHCTVTGATVHLTRPGSCTITAKQSGDPNHNAAPEVARTFSIAKTAQTITFDPLADRTDSDPDFNVSAFASSGLAVQFAGTGDCTVTGIVVHIVQAGSCTVTAHEVGDPNYAAAPNVARTFAIQKTAAAPQKSSQTIAFDPVAGHVYGDGDFDLGASASSRLKVAYTALGACTISGGTVHLTGAGACELTAHQGGNSSYNAADNVARTFSIAKAPTSVSLQVKPAAVASGDAVHLKSRVKANGVIPTGAIKFRLGHTVIDTVELNSKGVAKAKFVANETTGSYRLRAIYTNADGNFERGHATQHLTVG
jgi:Putative Ig domain